MNVRLLPLKSKTVDGTSPARSRTDSGGPLPVAHNEAGRPSRGPRRNALLSPRPLAAVHHFIRDRHHALAARGAKVWLVASRRFGDFLPSTLGSYVYVFSSAWPPLGLITIAGCVVVLGIL